MMEIKLFNRQDDLDAWLAQFGADNVSEQTRLLRLVQAHEQGQRSIVITKKHASYVGYVTIVWSSDYPEFQMNTTPEVVDLYTDTTCRRQGFATALMRCVENICQQRQLSQIGLTVGCQNHGAQAFYAAMGYHEKEQTTIQGESVFVMVKDIEC